MVFEVESDVAVSATKRNKETKYPFPTMEVGQSFLVEMDGDAEEKDLARRRTYGAVAWANRRFKSDGKKFISRHVADEGGMRVWRTE